MIVGNGRVLSSILEWEIDNYSPYSNFDKGKFICSPTFNVHHSLWYLCLYPNGQVNDMHKNISVFLNFKQDMPSGCEVQASFAFTLYDNRKKIIAIYGCSEMCPFSSEQSWGIPLFGNNSSLGNKSSTNKFDKITIVCEILMKEANVYKKILTISSERMKHLEEFKNLLNNQKFSDVKFTVENKVIHAHKMVLAANSTIFAAMFEHKMRENEENMVTIEDISYKVFIQLLSFVYTGDCTLSEDTISELFEAADKYQLLQLKDVCEKELCKNMSVNNAITSLQLADMHCAELLRKEAIDFIMIHGKEIIDKPEFESIGHLNPKLLKDIFREAFTRIS